MTAPLSDLHLSGLRVVIESPYAGEIDKNQAYLRDMIEGVIRGGGYPLATHAWLPGVLDDNKEEERRKGMLVHLNWLEVADVVVVGTDLGISRGMELGIAYAKLCGVPQEYVTVPGWGDVA